MSKKFRRIIGLGLLAVLLLTVGGFLLWALTPAQPETTDVESLQSAHETNEGWLVFMPNDSDSKIGLILYPGGRVDIRAYAPHAQAIANDGFTVVLVPMPLNFAFLGIDRAWDVMAAFPQIETWAVGGHSLGGAMAAEFANDNLDAIAGLVLWASYPGENNDLSNTNLPVLSIYASNDGLASPAKILNSKKRLPAETLYVEIVGGNHAGFAWYGSQRGDGVLEISKISQQNQVVEATAAFLNGLRE